MEAAAVPLGCAVALALIYPPRFIFDPQRTLKCYRYEEAFDKLQELRERGKIS